MADWPALVILLIAGTAAVALLVFYGGRYVVRKVRSHRNLVDATAERARVSLPPFPMPAHSAPARPLVPAAPPSQLMAAVPGRHSHEHLKLDAPTERMHAVPAPTHTPPVTPARGHRAATPARPANAPRTTDSGGHRVHRRVAAGTRAGARLTTSPR